MKLQLIAGCVGFLIAHAVPVKADIGSLEPYQLMRTLQMVQDRIASGDHAAMPMQRKLMALIDSRFRQGTRESVSGAKNLDAFLIYAMSGGSADTVSAIMPQLAEHETRQKIALGTLHYLRGQTRTAAKILMEVDPIKIEGDVGAYLALVRGSLVNDSDANDLVRNLNFARLLAPGTLVEESALRRLLAIYGRSRDAARFVRTAEIYARRFLRSPFAKQFADAFVSGIVEMDKQISEDDIREITDTIPASYRKALYLRLARLATLQGKTKLLSRTLDVLRGPVETQQDKPESMDERSRLYSAIASIGDGDSENLNLRLQKIDPSKLPKEDRVLLAATLALHSAIIDPSEATVKTVDAKPQRKKEKAAMLGKPAKTKKPMRTVYPDGRNLSSESDKQPDMQQERVSEPSPEQQAEEQSMKLPQEPDVAAEQDDDLQGFMADIRGRLNEADGSTTEVQQ